MATKKTTRLVADCDICGKQATDPHDWLSVTFKTRPLNAVPAFTDPATQQSIDFDCCSGCARAVGIVREYEGRRSLSVRAAFEALKRRLPWSRE